MEECRGRDVQRPSKGDDEFKRRQFLATLDPAEMFDTRVGFFGELSQVHLAGFSSRSNKLTEEFCFFHQGDDIG
jgi:hypothetical protein